MFDLPETAILLQRHLDGALQAAHQPGRLHHRVEHHRGHLQRGRHGGLLQRGSHGQQIWEVRVQTLLLVEVNAPPLGQEGPGGVLASSCDGSAPSS